MSSAKMSSSTRSSSTRSSMNTSSSGRGALTRRTSTGSTPSLSRLSSSTLRSSPSLSRHQSAEKLMETDILRLHEYVENNDVARVSALMEERPWHVDAFTLRPRATKALGFLDDVSPLHLAAANGNIEMVQVLLSHDADVNRRCEKLGTPLHVACSRTSNLAVVQLLVMKGADIEARNKEDEAPIFVAAKALDVDTVSYLLECNAQVDDVNDGRSLLPVSCRHGLQPIVKLLLDKGFDVETVVKGTGLTLLGIACQFIHGDAGMVEMLLEYGADVEARDSKGRSPLAIAAANASNPRIIVALLEAGADLEGADSKGATPLMMAALLENVDVVKVLLEYGASCEAVNNAGSNATHYCSSGNEVILQSLRRASEINEAAREVVPILK